MNTSETHLASKLGRSFVYGFRGLKSLLSQRNYRIAIYIVVAGTIFFGIYDRGFLRVFLVMSAIVLVSEGTNSTIERLCDFIHVDYHPVIGQIKDMAAANTVVAVLVASVLGLFEFVSLYGLGVGMAVWVGVIVLIYIIFSIWG